MGPTWHAFKPREDDKTGISLSRMQSDEHPEFLTIDAFAARACRDKPPEKHFYVAVLSAARLMDPPLSLALALDPIDKPGDRDPGHILVSVLNTQLDTMTRNTLTLTLAREYCIRIVGPFNCNGRVADGFVDRSAA